MRRRHFLESLIGLGLLVATDTDKLLWEPGRKLISIPENPLIDQHTRYWLGNTEEITFEQDFGWNNIQNWSASPGGPVGAPVPTGRDKIVVDGGRRLVIPSSTLYIDELSLREGTVECALTLRHGRLTGWEVALP